MIRGKLSRDLGTFSVLMYHRIGRRERACTLDPRLVSTTPEGFEAQVAYLARRTNVLSLDTLREVRCGRAQLLPRSVLVTFDDGYRDFAEVAWPILRRYDLPATLFVPTAYPGRPERAFWWDRLHAALRTTALTSLRLPSVTLPLRTAAERRDALLWVTREMHALDHERAIDLVDAVEAALDVPPARGCVLTWDELRTLVRDGLSVAPHTRTHPLLHRLDLDALDEEVLGSAADVERELDVPAYAFAYPGGFTSDAAVEAVHRAGFDLAFTTRRGRNVADEVDWLRLRRINVGARTSVSALRLQLLWKPIRPERVAR